MPEDGKFVTAVEFLENAKPRTTKIGELFDLHEAKKANSTKILDFWNQVEKKAKADKAAKEAQEAKARAEAEKEARAQQKAGRALFEEDDLPMNFGDLSDDEEEMEAETEQKSLYREIRDALYKDNKYDDLSTLSKRLADIRVMGQIVRGSYVEAKREAREWFNNTKFGKAVAEKKKSLAKAGSKCMDHVAGFCKGVKDIAGTGVDMTKRGLQAGYQFTADKAKAAKDWFVNTAAVQAASRKMQQYGAKASAAGKSMAHGFRKFFGIRELTEEEKKQRAEAKRRKAEAKAAAKKVEKEAKEKLKAKKKADKEFQKKLKALRKAMKAEDPTKVEKMADVLKDAALEGEVALGERFDKLMKAIDLSVQSQVQKDDIDEIIRRRADKSYDARMKKFKKLLHSDPEIKKKLKYRLDSDRWKEEFEAAKKRAEEEKKKKNGGKEEEEEEKSELAKKTEEISNKMKKKAAELEQLKKGRIGNAADYVTDIQNLQTAITNLKKELKKKKEEEEAKQKGQEKTEEKTAEKKAEDAPEVNAAPPTEKKSLLQREVDEAKKIASVANKGINTGLAIQKNVGAIVQDVQKLIDGEGSEAEVAEATKKTTDTLKQAGSFFGWDPSKKTTYVDKGADTLALFGKTREDLTDRMQKIKDGTATAEDYLAFENGITALSQNCLSYAKIDTSYINSFNKALKGMVEINKGKKVTENLLNVGQQLLTTANTIEKQITGGKGSLGTPITVLGSMEKIAGNLESLVQKTEQNQRLNDMSPEEMGKNVSAEDANLIRNGRDDIVGRNDISRYQLLGGAVKKAADTTASLVGGTIGTLYMKAAQPAFDALNKYMTEAMQKSLDEALVQKDVWKEEDYYKIDRDMNSMRNDEIIRLLRRETGSINGKHLADKIRFDLGMRLITNADKDNGFEALAKNAFGRKATDEEIMQLVGFKDFKDAENRVYKASENDDKLKETYENKAKDVMSKPSKADKQQAKKDKLHKNTMKKFDNILDADETYALTEEDEKKRVPLFMDDNKKNMVSFKKNSTSKKPKSKGL